MLVFHDLPKKIPPYVQFHNYAAAYLDSAEILCLQIQQRKDAGYAYGAVVLSLAFHSLELFFKGSILRMAPFENFSGSSGHDLDQLSRRFFNLYPAKEFQFEVPFGMSEAGPNRASQDNELNRIPADQAHRYPTGADGQPWKALFSFDPEKFLLSLNELKDVYIRLRPLMSST